MQITCYIRDLLYRHECVVLPNFGAFLTRQEPSRVHHYTHAFYPPREKLSFNSQIIKEDGLLAKHMAEREEISYEKAKRHVAHWVKELKEVLAAGEVVHLDNIGKLSLNAERKVAFDPSQHLNYHIDSFGLSQFSLAEIKREVFEEQVPILKNKKQKAKASLVNKKKPVFRYVAIVLIILSMGVYVLSDLSLSEIRDTNREAQKEANEQLEKKIQEATFFMESPRPTTTLNITRAKVNYHVIGGVFRIKGNALRLVENLKSLGYNAYLVGKNKYGLYQVAYQGFGDRKSALKALAKVRRTHNYEAWLLAKEGSK